MKIVYDYLLLIKENQDKKRDSKGDEGEVELFVDNLSFTATEDQISDFFSKYGDVASVKILQRV